jgi:hypothetical protein
MADQTKSPDNKKKPRARAPGRQVDSGRHRSKGDSVVNQQAADVSLSPVEIHVRHQAFLDALDDTVTWMASAVIAVLDDALDDAGDFEGDFRAAFQRACRRVLTNAAEREENVLFFHDAVPGFTVILVKKDGWLKALPKTLPASSKTKALVDRERDGAVQGLIETYVRRTGNRVLSIEGNDVSIVMFPVADLKNNLKDMGFWTG